MTTAQEITLVTAALNVARHHKETIDHMFHLENLGGRDPEHTPAEATKVTEAAAAVTDLTALLAELEA